LIKLSGSFFKKAAKNFFFRPPGATLILLDLPMLAG
jgi:hypothetical protein